MNSRLDNISGLGTSLLQHSSQTMSSSETLVGQGNNIILNVNNHRSNVSVNDIYKRTEVIGRGKFGIVYKGYNRKSSQVVAIKVLNLDTDQEEVKDVQQEILFLSQLKQAPNIIHYHGSYLSDTKLWIIMDYCAGGSVRSLLKPGRMEEKYIGVIVRELLIALQYVHKAGVIHRDLKAANVLITKEGNVQLCDFGVAAQLTSNALKRTTMAGTPYWMAPEVIMEGTKYDVKVDIWSLGITIYEIATGNPPYSDKDAMRAMQLITKSKPPRLEGRNHSSLLKEMIALCLDENPDERPTADDLLKSRFVRAHKNTPTSILKEIISRYLIWREKKSSRDSMTLYGMDDEMLENNSNASGNGGLEEDGQNMKWDFDSLNSSEYIMENDINVNQISHAPEYGEEIYNDEDEFMMTTDQQTYMTGNELINSREDPTLRMTGTVGGTTMGTRKEAPKSLLQLFEEEERDDMMGNLQMPNQNDKEVNSGFPKLPTLPSSNGARSSSPMIEIPNMDDITVSEPPPKARSRAPTLSHTQSAAAVLGRVSDMSELPTAIQRRPTLSQVTSPASAPPQGGFPLQFPASLTPSTSSLSAVTGRTPSPKRPNPINNTDTVNLSPQRISGMTPSSAMKPLPSSVTMSALLQPINKPSGDASVQSQNSEFNMEWSSPTPISSSQGKTRNAANLHLNMPAPTSASPSLKALTDFDHHQHHQQQQQLQIHQQYPHHQQQRSLSSASSPAPRDGVRINQFGYDAAQALATPLTMTPLNEKSQLSAMNAFLNGLPPTGSITPPRETRSRTGSTVNSVTPGTSSFFLSKDEVKRSKFPEIPKFNSSLLLDGVPDCKQKLIEEIDSISTKLITLMNIMEEDFTMYIE